jgi:protease-4
MRSPTSWSNQRLRTLYWCLCLCSSLLACTARERFVSEDGEPDGASLGESGDGYVAVFDLSQGAPEQAAAGLFQLPANRTYTGLIRTLSETLDDSDAKAVFVRLSQQNYDWAQVEEIGRLLARIRKAEKSVTCHAHTLTNSTTWLLLRGCDKVWLSPAGEVNSVGIAAQMTYLKGALDKLKIQADFLSMGKFKSGGEPITQEGPSEPSRKNLTETLRSIRASWLKGAATARKAPGLAEALETGPYVPETAKKKGLVDAVGFEADALATAKNAGGVAKTKVVFGAGRKDEAGGIAELVRILAGAEGDDDDRDHIAVVPAVGGITMAASGGFGSDGITANAMLKTLKRLRRDKAAKAVVLRLDSPGGSPLASDLIWREVMELKKKKPVIVSVGGMAASGGYYIACAGDKILAESTSIVGSIGVFGGKFVVGEALGELGITSYTFAASDKPGAAARAAYMSPLTSWDDPTRDRVRQHMRHIYDLFLKRVAKGRGLPLDQVKKNAEGAIFSGKQGKQNKLVDRIGGLHEAIEEARKRAALSDEAPIVVKGLQDSVFESLFASDEPSAGDVEVALEHWQSKNERWQSLVPTNLRTFVTSLLPLTQGEHSLVAVPFVLSIH